MTAKVPVRRACRTTGGAGDLVADCQRNDDDAQDIHRRQTYREGTWIIPGVVRLAVPARGAQRDSRAPKPQNAARNEGSLCR